MPRDKHRCVEWTRLGLPCPAELITESQRKREKVKEHEPADELEKEASEQRRINVAVGEKNKRQNQAEPDAEFRGVSQADWEALLLKVAQEAAAKRIGPQVPVPVPAGVVRVIASKGITGRTLGMWVATVAAFLAVGLAFGPKGLQGLPGFLAGRAGGGGPGGRSQGRGGFHNNAASELQLLLEGGPLRRTGANDGSDSGGGFSGTEG